MNNKQKESPLKMKFPVLDLIHWGRVIFDELHELDEFDNFQLSSLLNFSASFRWGLTGTPQNVSVRTVASI